MHYRQDTGKLPANDEIRSLPISSKRPRGRPKKGSCQIRSPVKVPPAPLNNPPEGVPTVMVTVPFVGCTSCQEEGHVNVSVAYCEECTEYLCEEHRRAHSKTRLTKGHNVIHVRDLRLADKVQELEEPLLPAEHILLAEPLPLVEPLPLAEPLPLVDPLPLVEPPLPEVRARRTRHPPVGAPKRKKITDLIE